MRKNMVVGIAMAVGILSFGALSASAEVSDVNMANCSDQQVNQQVTDETKGLVSELKAKQTELKDLNYTDGQYDTRKASELEKEVKELKVKINAVAHMHGMQSCIHS